MAAFDEQSDEEADEDEREKNQRNAPAGNHEQQADQESDCGPDHTGAKRHPRRLH